MSPPETKAISERSGEIAGSVKYGNALGGAVWPKVLKQNAVNHTGDRMRKQALPFVEIEVRLFID